MRKFIFSVALAMALAPASMAQVPDALPIMNDNITYVPCL